MSGVVATPSSMFGVAVPLTDVFGGLSLLPVSPMAARLTDCDAFDLTVFYHCARIAPERTSLGAHRLSKDTVVIQIEAM